MRYLLYATKAVTATYVEGMLKVDAQGGLLLSDTIMAAHVALVL